MTKKRVVRSSGGQETKPNNQAYLFATTEGEFKETIIPFCEISMMQIGQDDSLVVHFRGKPNTITFNGKEDPNGYRNFMVQWLAWLEKNYR